MSNQEDYILQSQELIASNQILIKINRKHREKQHFHICPYIYPRMRINPEQLMTSIIQELQNMMKEYIEKMGAMYNSLTTLVTRIT